MKKKIIIVAGDPNSINSEIIYKSLKKINNNLKKKIFIISNFRLLKEQFKRLKYNLNLTKVKNLDEIIRGNSVKILDIKLKFNDPFNVSFKHSSNYVIESLELAHKYASEGQALGIINCAINKKLLKKEKIGVTEFLASKSRIKNNSEVMLIYNNKFAVSPITTHIDIKQVSNKIGIKKFESEPFKKFASSIKFIIKLSYS